MKNRIIMLICATLICGSIGAQKITMDKVPAPVAAAFKAKFATVTTASWRMVDGKNYAADFKLNNVSESVKFNATGGWMSTETGIKVTEVPAVVKETLTKQFAGYTISSASKVENADHGMGYDVTIAKGKEMLDVTLSAKGVVMSQAPHPATDAN